MLLSAVVAVGSAELAARLWGLVPSYAWAGAGVVLLGTDRFLAPRQLTDTMELVSELSPRDL